jgi:hypothetical protein
MSAEDTRIMVATLDGHEALACVIVRPGTEDGHVSCEARAHEISKKSAAAILHQIANLWDAEEGSSSEGRAV